MISLHVKLCGRAGIRTCDSWICSQTCYRLRDGARQLYFITVSNLTESAFSRKDKFLKLCKGVYAAQCERVSSDICRPRRPRSACASAQSVQGIHCKLKESLNTIDCMNGEQRPGWYFTNARMIWICAFESIVSHDTTQIINNTVARQTKPKHNNIRMKIKVRKQADSIN